MIILVRKGACLSKIVDRLLLYWSHSSVRFGEGELNKVDEVISRKKLCRSIIF